MLTGRSAGRGAWPGRARPDPTGTSRLGCSRAAGGTDSSPRRGDWPWGDGTRTRGAPTHRERAGVTRQKRESAKRYGALDRTASSLIHPHGGVPLHRATVERVDLRDPASGRPVARRQRSPRLRPRLRAVPKVVFVVGPVGAATDGYRAQARVAASIARHYTPDVTELYSPNATWPAVKAALKGASLVVYMGHGNGWPSRYRDDLFPATQNGLGLNPTPGGSDSTHQYFGEALVGSSSSSSPRMPSSCSTTCATPAATPSLASPKARSPRLASGSTTTRPASSGRERQPSSPRRGRTPITSSARSSAARGRSRTPGCAARARTGTSSGSPASEARGTSPRWTRRRAPPASPARSS